MPINPEIINSELVKFGEGLPAPLPEYFESLKNQYCLLTIQGLADKEGYELVHKARMNVRDLRVKIEKKRKELKADSIAYGNAVDGEAKRINALIEPIDTYLADQEQAIDAEKERIRKAKEEERMAEIRAQIAAEETKKLEAETARLEEARKAQEEAQRLMAEKQAEFQAMVKAKEEELRQKEIKIEAEKIASQKMEEIKKAIPPYSSVTPEVVPASNKANPLDVHPISRITDLEEIEEARIAIINKFFEPYDVNSCDHVEAPSKEKHVLYDHRYIVKDKYIDKDIVEYILDEMGDVVYGIAVKLFGMGGK